MVGSRLRVMTSLLENDQLGGALAVIRWVVVVAVGVVVVSDAHGDGLEDSSRRSAAVALVPHAPDEDLLLVGEHVELVLAGEDRYFALPKGCLV